MEKVKLIRGSKERAEEILKTLEELGGTNKYSLYCGVENVYYFVNSFGYINCKFYQECDMLVAEGRAEIYELPPLKPKFEPFEKVLVRDDDDMNWFCDFFSNLETDKDRIADGYVYCTIGGVFKQCVKYEGNEALLGTNDNPK